MKFNNFCLRPALQKGIADRGYTDTTDVQEQTLAITLKGRDVAVQSQTGTGKTAAFLITLFERMSHGNATQRNKALVIVPTRELAVQIDREAQLLNRHLGFSVGSFFGGIGYVQQLNKLRKGCDILIGTPGRLLDLSERKDLNLKDIGFLVIDEADRLFDMGFLPDITKILKRMPPRKERQTMLFSATLNRASQTICREYLNHPESIVITPKQMTVDTISQEIYHVKSHIKMNLMLGLLKLHSPLNALIFTNMRHSAFRISRKLQINGYRSRHLTGDLPQNKRLQVMKDFDAGKFDILVATDVAARGLQIDGLEMVINYDLPQDYENYVHRIGRTARAGNTGKAISLASEGTARHLDAIESFIGQRIPEKPTDFELYATDESVGSEMDRRDRKRGPHNKKTSLAPNKWTRKKHHARPGLSAA